MIVDVLIIGSGPTGLVAALEAKRLGLSTRIIERKAGRSIHNSRTLFLNSRIKELLHTIGEGRVTEEILDRGFNWDGVRFQIGGSKELVDVTLEEDLFGDTDFPFTTSLPQCTVEEVLERELDGQGVEVERETEVKSFTQRYDFVETTVHKPNNNTTTNTSNASKETIVSRYVVGCDGARSKTRKLLKLGMTSQKSNMHFLVADLILKKSSVKMLGESKKPIIFLHDAGVMTLFPLLLVGEYRVFVQSASITNHATQEKQQHMDKLFMTELLRQMSHGKSLKCNFVRRVKVFEITHAVAQSYRAGRVFLAGDAAHVHSPVCGQGTNFGIQDACNLMWKLAWVERCRKFSGEAVARSTSDVILDSYDLERRTMGMQVMKHAERAMKLLVIENHVVQYVRNWVLRTFGEHAFQCKAPVLGQLTMRYWPNTSGILSSSSSGGGGMMSRGKFVCEVGERMPNLKSLNGSSLYDFMDRRRHTWILLNSNASSQDATQEGEDLSFVGPGGIKQIRFVLSETQATSPYIPKQSFHVPQAILVRPDLFVAVVGHTAEDAWERMAHLFGRDALCSM